STRGAAEDLTDEMILRSFKIVVRGVRFLDIWNQHHSPLDDYIKEEEEYEDNAHIQDMEDIIPPTPPADTTTHSITNALPLQARSVPESTSDSEDVPQSTVRSRRPSAQHGSPPQPQKSHPLPSTPYAQTPRAGTPSSSPRIETF